MKCLLLKSELTMTTNLYKSACKLAPTPLRGKIRAAANTGLAIRRTSFNFPDGNRRAPHRQAVTVVGNFKFKMTTSFSTPDHLIITSLARTIAKSTCKLYIHRKDKISVPQSLGTSLLLEFNGNHYCISNAHVLIDEDFGKAFVINKAAKSMTIGGHFFSTRMPENGKREDDTFDLSIVKFPDDAVKWLKDSGYLFIGMDKINSGFTPSKDDLMLMVGYPASTTKTIIRERKIITQPFYYVTNLSQNGVTGFNFSDDHHIIVNYQRKRITNPITKKIQTGPLPYGMSGGGLWQLQKNNDGDWAAYLVGVMFEYLKKHSAIVSTKIGVALEIIKHKLDPTIPSKDAKIIVTD